MKSWQQLAVYIVAAVLITASVTAAITANVVQRGKKDTVSFSVEEYAQLRDLLVLDEIMESVQTEALHDAPARADMTASAARGIVASIDDPYAAYYTPEEYEAYLSNINGEYTGIGVVVGQPDENGALVLDVYKGYAAEASGVKVGDLITAINGRGAANMTLEELLNEAEGEIGSVTSLDILRDGERLQFDVTNMQINVPRVTSALFNERTAYVRINMFTGNCVSEFEAAFKDLTERGMRSLVIDLRNNPGGSLESVIAIADMLLGKCTIVSVKGRASEEQTFTGKGDGLSVPLAVLVNENSASASEILAAAVQDNDAGVVVGMKTYGKGSVQTTSRLSGDSGWLKLTTDAYYTPSGKSINGIGVMPDIEVDLPDDMKGTAIDKIDQENDAQLWAALDYVRDLAEQNAA
ncbi:MAG: S41 family peptidase [Eubacteriales bacterium]|nr:S41 family peptidase [Eubacteriales bacterium]